MSVSDFKNGADISTTCLAITGKVEVFKHYTPTNVCFTCDRSVRTFLHTFACDEAHASQNGGTRMFCWKCVKRIAGGTSKIYLMQA